MQEGGNLASVDMSYDQALFDRNGPEWDGHLDRTQTEGGVLDPK